MLTNSCSTGRWVGCVMEAIGDPRLPTSRASSAPHRHIVFHLTPHSIYLRSSTCINIYSKFPRRPHPLPATTNPCWLDEDGRVISEKLKRTIKKLNFTTLHK